MKKKLLILLFGVLSYNVYAQTDILLTQQIFSRMNFNPAATGASQYTNIFLLGRWQWLGIDGAPVTQYLDAHKYFPLINSGMGITFEHDRIGLEYYYDFQLAYAYHVRLGDNSYLSFGLSGGVEYHTVSANKIYEDPLAPTVILEDQSKWSPDFDFGIEWGYKRLLLGASVTHIQKSPTNKDLSSGRHFYGYVQYQIPIREWTLSPSVILTNTVNTFNLDALVLGTYDNLFWVGGAFRFNEKFTGTSLSALAGIWIMKDLRLGYSYDASINGQTSRNSGTHEIMLNLRFGKQLRPARYPRFIEF